MGNSKHSFLKQWFTFTYKNDNTTDLIYSCTNNHYIQGWLEERGYTEFCNELSEEDLEEFIIALNESSNMVPDTFEENFSEEYIDGYSLWDMDNKRSWKDVSDYRTHAKEQMCELFERLYEYEDRLENGVEGILKYHIFYTH